MTSRLAFQTACSCLHAMSDFMATGYKRAVLTTFLFLKLVKHVSTALFASLVFPAKTEVSSQYFSGTSEYMTHWDVFVL